MTDIVVTVPRAGWPRFLEEPCTAFAQRTWLFYPDRPPLNPGDWLHVVSHGRLRCAIVIDRALMPQRGGFLACGLFRPAITIGETIDGFRGWKRVWWSPRELEEFPEWRTKSVWFPQATAEYGARIDRGGAGS